MLLHPAFVKLHALAQRVLVIFSWCLPSQHTSSCGAHLLCVPKPWEDLWVTLLLPYTLCAAVLVNTCGNEQSPSYVIGTTPALLRPLLGHYEVGTAQSVRHQCVAGTSNISTSWSVLHLLS